MKNLFVVTCIFLFAQLNLHCQDLCPGFETWEKYYVSEGFIECDPDTVVFFDDFNIDGLDTSKWYTFTPCPDKTDSCQSSRLPDLGKLGTGTIRRDENVLVNNGTCKLITTQEDTSNQWYGVHRLYNGGFLQAKGGWHFATFEAKVQAPIWDDYWETFWLWNHDEFDIVEDANAEEFRTNFYPRNDLDVCDTTFWRSYGAGEDFNALNTYKVKITPYKVSFFFNDIESSYFDLFRYYNESGAPMDLDCGSIFPAGVYRIDPRFPRLYQRWMRPLLNNKVHRSTATGQYVAENPFIPENAIMVVDDVKVTEHYFDVCGSLQHQLPDDCSVSKWLKIMPVGDNSNHLNIIDIATSPNIKDSIVLSQWNQLAGKLFYERLDIHAGYIDINYIGECGDINVHRIDIPALNTNCACNMIISEDFTINLPLSVYAISVTNGAKLTILDTEVSFDALGKLFVKDGASLEVNNSVLKGCDGEWRGVVGDPSGGLIKVTNGSLIRDAQIGIELPGTALNDPGRTDIPLFDLTLEIENSTITNCQTGIHFELGISSSFIRENSVIQNNGIGISYENHTGLMIDDTRFYNNLDGILSSDGYMHVRSGNEFDSNDIGIRLMGTYPNASGVDIGDMGAGHNSFSNNEYASILSEGSEHPAGVNIVNCVFDNNPLAALFAGANFHKFYNNEVNSASLGLYAGATGDNDNESRCNEFNNIAFYGHYYEHDNSRTQFLENHFLENVDNYHFSQTVMAREIGTIENPAANCFSTNGIDLNTVEGVNEFKYFFYDDGLSTNCQEPVDNDDIEKREAPDEGNNCDGTIGIFGLIEPGGGGITGITTYSNDPNGFTNHISKTTLATTIQQSIDSVILKGGDNPRTLVYDPGTNESTDLFSAEVVMNEWINYAVYRGMVQRDFAFIESILVPLNDWHWQKRLLGTFLQQGKINEAAQLINQLPIRTENEIRFKTVQTINLKRFHPNKEANIISESELTSLANIAQSPYSASGYARGLYRSVTGVSLPIDLPPMETQPEERRQRPAKNHQEQYPQNILIYPIPATNRLFVSSSEQIIKQLKIIDLNGYVLFNDRPNSYNCELEVDHLDFGLYLLKILTENGNVLSRKFVK